MAEEAPKSSNSQNEIDEDNDNSGDNSPPSKVARISSEQSPGTVTTAIGPPLALGLNLTLATAPPPSPPSPTPPPTTESVSTETTKSAFTFMQLQEYYHQELIFKHMVAGVAVPIHLILPIWKSVAASYGPHHYPSFAGLGNLCYEFRNNMEPEPGRCRRTDGKKWRCSRDVVPEQKYCERHMHRGRNRSRNHVDLTADDSPPPAAADTTAVTDTTTVDIGRDDDADKNDRSSANGGNNDVTIARVGSSPISVE